MLGTVSGSGVATTVTLATLAWPMLKRSGYPPNVAGGMLAAAGIGALLSPPTLGAAAFIIAEYLKVSYFDVLVMATIPTLLYYLSCALMVEADARRLNVQPVKTSWESAELRRRCEECGAIVPISDQVCKRCGRDLDFPTQAIAPKLRSAR